MYKQHAYRHTGTDRFCTCRELVSTSRTARVTQSHLQTFGVQSTTTTDACYTAASHIARCTSFCLSQWCDHTIGFIRPCTPTYTHVPPSAALGPQPKHQQSTHTYTHSLHVIISAWVQASKPHHAASPQRYTLRQAMAQQAKLAYHHHTVQCRRVLYLRYSTRLHCHGNLLRCRTGECPRSERPNCKGLCNNTAGTQQPVHMPVKYRTCTPSWTQYLQAASNYVHPSATLFTIKESCLMPCGASVIHTYKDGIFLDTCPDARQHNTGWLAGQPGNIAPCTQAVQVQQYLTALTCRRAYTDCSSSGVWFVARMCAETHCEGQGAGKVLTESYTQKGCAAQKWCAASKTTQ